MPEGFLYYIWEGNFYISRSKEFFNNKKGNYEMEKEYTTFSINMVGVGCEVDLLPIHIKTLNPKLFNDLKKFIKKYNKHIENEDKYIFNGLDYIKTT